MLVVNAAVLERMQIIIASVILRKLLVALTRMLVIMTYLQMFHQQELVSLILMFAAFVAEQVFLTETMYARIRT